MLNLLLLTTAVCLAPSSSGISFRPFQAVSSSWSSRFSPTSTSSSTSSKQLFISGGASDSFGDIPSTPPRSPSSEEAATSPSASSSGANRFVNGLMEAQSQSQSSKYESEYEEIDEVQPRVLSEGKKAVYEAYNVLHNLAQQYKKPFDSPAVLVVGHQSSGKSALIEAIIGFQFNQVGGGTKTRRPVALKMQYNPKFDTPVCYLQGDDGKERPASLQEIQRYIESENNRLEMDKVRCFDSREINIRMEYKECPNMILIDTPGLISAPKTPKGSLANAQSRSLQVAAREAEKLVIDKMNCQDYIILCVEDTSDWKHGATREIVQKADPELSRTVIVNTKLDTKVPQFGDPADMEEFLKAPIISRLAPHKLGGPFFTSVPSGRVGQSESHAFRSDKEFVKEVKSKENSDRAYCQKTLKADPRLERALLPRIGVLRLKGFLERRVHEFYKKNMSKIIPTLQAELAQGEQRLEQCERALEALSIDRLKQSAETYCDGICKAISDGLHGTIAVSPGKFGETLSEEHQKAGSFNDRCEMAVSERKWDRLVDSDVGNNNHKLYGGSQYHRTLREFCLATRCLRLPTISEDEVANAAGVGDTHDGVNFLRAACVIAVEKAKMSFDPMLESLESRLYHIMENLFPVAESIVKKKAESNKDLYGDSDSCNEIIYNKEFIDLVKNIYIKFMKECGESCSRRYQDDLKANTKYVTWNFNEGSSGALKNSLPNNCDIVRLYQVVMSTQKNLEGGEGDSNNSIQNSNTNNNNNNNHDAENSNNYNTKRGASATKQRQQQQNERGLVANERKDMAAADAYARDTQNLIQLLQEAACSRDAKRTTTVIGGLVQHIVGQWRDVFATTVKTKTNCFFLMPFQEDFPRYLRKELQKAYDGDMSSLFDIEQTRKDLIRQRDNLINECEDTKKSIKKFEEVSHEMMMETKKREAAEETERMAKAAKRGGGMGVRRSRRGEERGRGK